MNIFSPKECGHGKPWEDECLECQLIWEQDTVDQFEPMVISAKKRIQEIKKALRRAVKEKL